MLRVGLVGLAMVAVPLVLLALWYVASSLGLRNGWGDTGRYLRASHQLKISDTRELLYPILLMLSRVFTPGGWQLGGVQVFQIGVSFVSVLYLTYAFWRAGVQSPESEVRSPESGISTPDSGPRTLDSASAPWGLLVVLAGVIVCLPILMHLQMSILTDSLAGSFAAAMLAGLILADRDPARRRYHLAAGGAAMMLLGIIRPEKFFTLTLFFASLIAIVWWLRRRRSADLERWGTWRSVAIRLLLIGLPLILLVKVATPRNQDKYPSGYNPLILLSMRVNLQGFGDIYHELSGRTRAVFTPYDIEYIDSHRAHLNMLVERRLRRHPEVRNAILYDIIVTSLRYRLGPALSQFAMDAGCYILPPAGFYLELNLPRKPDKYLDFSRHQRNTMIQHGASRSYQAAAGDAYLRLGMLAWALGLGTLGLGLVTSPALRAVVRERLDVLGVLAIWHFWAVFPFLFMHNQFIVRYALPAMVPMTVLVPTLLVLGYQRSRAPIADVESRDRAEDAAGSKATDVAPPRRRALTPAGGTLA